MQAAYGLDLTKNERIRAIFQEYLVWRWRRRVDAATFLVLDEATAAAWSGRRNMKVFWLPEPPVIESRPRSGTDGDPQPRSGFLMFGAIDHRKGLDQVCAAVVDGGQRFRISIAGPVSPDYRSTVERAISMMQRAGAHVELIDEHLSEDEALSLMRATRCVLLTYPRHLQMSRVLLEAAVAGTPVIAHSQGVPGWLVRKHCLGLSVDCSDPRVLSKAMCEILDADIAQWTLPLAGFAARYSASAFAAQVQAAVES
jgi:glycosyltransferase involved in cell wall biosynthesis